MRVLSSMEDEFPEVSFAEGSTRSDGPTMVPVMVDGPAVTSMPPLEPEHVVKFEATVGVTVDPGADQAPESLTLTVAHGHIIPIDQLPEPVVVEQMEP